MKERITKNTRKDGSVSWGYVYDAGLHPNGKRRQIRKKGFKTKHEALDALQEATNSDKEPISKDKRTFGIFFQEWLLQHSAKHWGKLTTESNLKRAGYAIRMFGDVPIQKLKAMRIEQDLATLLAKGGRKTVAYPDGRPLSSKTVREVAALVPQALDRAVDWEIIPRNPMERVDRPSAHKKEVEIPEPEQFEKLLEVVQHTRYYAFCVFAAASGCRRGEMLALQWSDINPKNGVVTISKSLSQTKEGLEIKVPKSRKTRFVRVSMTTLQVLLEHKKRLEEEHKLYGSDYGQHDLVFPTPDGNYYSPAQITNRISEFMQKAGIDASLHSLRHLHASLMLSNQVPIAVVSKRLGHANNNITLDVYTHAMKTDEASAAQTWDDATAEIIQRTQRQSPKAVVTSCDFEPILKLISVGNKRP